MAYSGKYFVVNKTKYKGDFNKVTYRSSWEQWFMKYCDLNPQVIKWNSEEVVIPYYSQIDQKKRRYFMDFYVKYSDNSEWLFEVKPKKELFAPKKPVKLTTKSKERYETELYTFSVNGDKWRTARTFAEKLGIKFRILTEDGLKQMGFKGR